MKKVLFLNNCFIKKAKSNKKLSTIEIIESFDVYFFRTNHLLLLKVTNCTNYFKELYGDQENSNSNPGNRNATINMENNPVLSTIKKLLFFNFLIVFKTLGENL